MHPLKAIVPVGVVSLLFIFTMAYLCETRGWDENHVETDTDPELMIECVEIAKTMVEEGESFDAIAAILYKDARRTTGIW